MNMRKYLLYKYSGVDWLGSVPDHWSVHRLKNRMKLCTEKTDQRTNSIALENVASWSGKYISTDSEFEGDGISFQRGDILFGKLRPYLAKVYLADGAGEAVGDFHVLRPADYIVSRYAQYQILNRNFIEIIDSCTFGSKMPRANWETLGSMPFVLPPYAEQEAIANFLDRETGKIDALMTEQEMLIALLTEKRQAIISQAVVRGLNSEVPIKNSGVGPLGDVPAHWKVCHLRRVLQGIEQGWSPECMNRPAEGQEWGVLKSGCVNGGRFSPNENKALPEEMTPNQGIEVHDGDLLMSRASGSPALVGSVAYVLDPPPRLMLSDKIFRIHLESAVSPRFLATAFTSQYLRHQIQQAISGAEGLANNLPQSRLKSFTIVIPPAEEQKAISAFVEAKIAKLNALVVGASRAIGLLNDRRSALITAAVTGQIDVRTSVPQLDEREDIAA